ncbi:MAG: alpha/beta hydrolase [Verrucomicrobiaceae bacterium]|nr:alpha/beta hydrolase [Verrucomicrobiaceae bacterium]
MKRLIASILFLPLGGIAQTSLPPATFADISYGPHERNKLDLWQAKSAMPTPLVVFVHGGGWAGGDKKDALPKLHAFLIAHGVSFASINYRYSTTAILPVPVHDAARAVQFLRSKAAGWNLDPAHFGAYGVSAGGCTTLWLALHDDLADHKSADPVAQQSTRLQAAVGVAPQTSLEPHVVSEWIGNKVLQHPMIGRAVGLKKGETLLQPKPEWTRLLAEFSPINHVSRDDPPLLLAFTHDDPLPAASAGSAIHHALFGRKLREKALSVGANCIVRIEDEKPGEDIPKPEAFLLRALMVK